MGNVNVQDQLEKKEKRVRLKLEKTVGQGRQDPRVIITFSLPGVVGLFESQPSGAYRIHNCSLILDKLVK